LAQSEVQAFNGGAWQRKISKTFWNGVWNCRVSR